MWPLSNDAYSKQFLRLLPAPDGTRESMFQRVMRQIRDSGLEAEVTVATSEGQRDVISSQIGNTVNVVTEPERRDTFPVIALTCLYLEKEKLCKPDEVVVVMPSDPYTDAGYFRAIGQMKDAVERGTADLVLMGIHPTASSTKYGYIVPADTIGAEGASDMAMGVGRFTEKPDEEKAKELIAWGALWNGGVFAFRLGYLEEIISHYLKTATFREACDRYEELLKISFDYEVAEKAKSVAVIPFDGLWEDLGTWDALSEVIGEKAVGNVLLDEDCYNTHVVNTLDIPCVYTGTDSLIVATSPAASALSRWSAQ